MKKTKTKMSEEEIKVVHEMMSYFGFYQAFQPIKEWFDWDDETTSKNMKQVLNQNKDE